MPIDKTLRDALSAVTTASLGRVLARRGVPAFAFRGLRPRAGSAQAVGAAFTLRLIPARGEAGLPLSRTIESIPEGAVVVADTGGSGEALPFGTILAARLGQRGIAGLVTDGAGPAEGAMPAWGAPPGAMRAGSGLVLVGAGEPIACAGAAIHPGDVVVADAEGAVVIPGSIAESVALEAVEQQRLDLWIQREVEKGVSLDGLLPPDAAALARFEAETKPA
ncbi:RraA family protein [Methylobacterium planeticum]|uniref:Dimethylmenaquinone methyltransferase n=1 Tax=Methylobacterium planeticum TaxID=2615211 RepID=A0A6N6MW30_9HYPH|nr:dimethylmenaquinone methyltransferase [Methylobacterium planeticum]KAB1076285.1 dimethylmenaquinone methyltransferase [Methylobacterium planeticum]